MSSVKFAGARYVLATRSHIITRHRQQVIEIGVDLLERRMEREIVVQLLGLSQRRLAVVDESRPERVLGFVELRRGDAVRPMLSSCRVSRLSSRSAATP